MAGKYFGTDGIRGRANGVITPELALKVGQAAGLAFQRGEHRHRVVIGKDTRLSGYMVGQNDQLQIQRLKKRKLILRDRLTYLEDQLTPDIIA